MILYIAGAGRSGSTILNLLLSDNDCIIGLGELNNLFTSGWINNEYCSCGKPANECEFWSEIKKKWKEESTLSIAEYAALQTKYIRFRNLPILVWQKINKSADFKIFEAETKRLYTIIQEVSGKSVLVDSSKTPYRLWALKLMGLTPKIIHLVRDGRAVLNSLKKGHQADLKAGVQHDLKPKSTIRTAFFWIGMNRMVEIISNGLPYYFLRYEDLIADNQNELRRLEGYFDIDLSNVKNKLSENKPLLKGHAIAGNRLRMQKEIRVKLKPDESWRVKVPKADLKKFESIAERMLKRYGYK